MINDGQLPKRSKPAHWPVFEIANRSAIVFVTACVRNRRPLLVRPEIHQLLEAIWREANEWLVGRYVLMPDHVHLFCAPSQKEALPLEKWIKFWKSHSTKRWPHVAEKPIWQPDFWDRQLRRSESYAEKWNYVLNNPVRAGLCANVSDWQFQGEITQFRFHDG